MRILVLFGAHVVSACRGDTQMLASLSICARRPTAVDQRKSFAAPTSMIQLPTEGSPQNTDMATVDAAPHWQASPPKPIMMVRGPQRRGARDDSGASGRAISIPRVLPGGIPGPRPGGWKVAARAPGPESDPSARSSTMGDYEAKPPRPLAAGPDPHQNVNQS